MNKRPALTAALLLAAGVLIGERVSPAPGLTFAFLSAFWALAVFCHVRIRSGPAVQAGAALCVTALGIFRVSVQEARMDRDAVSVWASPPRQVELSGVVARDPVRKLRRTEVWINVISVSDGRARRPSGVKVIVPLYDGPTPPLGYGDRVVVTGVLTLAPGRRNPGAFDYRDWLRRQGVPALLLHAEAGDFRLLDRGGGNFLLRRVVYPARRFIESVLDAAARSTDARGLLRSLVLGDQGLVSPELRDDFSRTGVVHILSVSGSHVAFMAMLLSLVVGCLGLKGVFRTAAVLAGLCFYALLTEANAPVVRASVMAAALLVGGRLERPVDPYNALGTAALIILLMRPLDLFDPGFQLSFLSVFSIVYGYGRMRESAAGKWLSLRTARSAALRAASAAVLVSMAAQAGTLPVTARYFNWIPLVSMPANAVAIPLSGLILAVSFTAVAAGGIQALGLQALRLAAPGLAASGHAAFGPHPGAASAFRALDGALAWLFIRVLDLLEKIPFSCLTVPSPGPVHMVLAYAGLLLIVHFGDKAFRRRLVLLILAACNFAVWPSVLRGARPAAVWVQFDVGQGDAALFLLPGGRTLLIDAGGGDGAFNHGEKTLAPFLRKNGIRRLDAMVLTHSHADHIGGAGYLLDGFRVGGLWLPGPEDTSAAWQPVLETAAARGVPVKRVARLDTLDDFPGALVLLANPSCRQPPSQSGLLSENQRSLVALVAVGRARWISMGDADGQAESDLLTALAWDRCDALKVAHHGSRRSASAEWLFACPPRTAIVSVGATNRFGHPNAETLSRLRASGARVFRTDSCGAVVLETDGIGTKVREWK